MKNKKITVKLLRRHITAGAQRQVCSCPIALAIRERLKLSIGSVSVGHRVFISGGPLKHAQFHIPKQAQKFICYFDSMNRVEAKLKPFTFTMTRAKST